MTLEPPAPPTAPAPAIRPTPPTPPRIDKGAFNHDDSPQVTRKVDTPETMARDAVAHGSGALTKRTVDRGDSDQSPPNQTVTIIPPAAPLTDTQSDYDRGQDVLREFKDLDAREAQSRHSSAQVPTEPTQPVAAHVNQDEGHGIFYWIFTIVFVIVAAGVFGSKFLYTGKRARVRTPFFDGLPEKRKATADKPKPVTPPPTPPVKPVTLPPKKDDDDKGKHFEVRV